MIKIAALTRATRAASVKRPQASGASVILSQIELNVEAETLHHVEPAISRRRAAWLAIKAFLKSTARVLRAHPHIALQALVLTVLIIALGIWAAWEGARVSKLHCIMLQRCSRRRSRWLQPLPLACHMPSGQRCKPASRAQHRTWQR